MTKTKKYKMRKLIILALAATMFAACGTQKQLTETQYTQSVQKDLPFAVSEFKQVKPDVYAFKCDKYVDMLPDYEVDDEGASMGGAGTWRLLGEMPNTFAAALIASGSYRRANTTNIAKAPVWCTIGGAEEAKRMQSLQEFVEQIRQAGGEVRYDTIPGLNHPQTCEQSFTAERIGWVMGHSK